jgi:hypothetical protein
MDYNQFFCSYEERYEDKRQAIFSLAEQTFSFQGTAALGYRIFCVKINPKRATCYKNELRYKSTFVPPEHLIKWHPGYYAAAHVDCSKAVQGELAVERVRFVTVLSRGGIFSRKSSMIGGCRAKI